MNIDTYGMIGLTVNDLIGKSIFIGGIKGSGKSNTAAVIMEEFLFHSVPICVIDIEGEYFSLKDIDRNLMVVGGSLNCVVDIRIDFDNAPDVAKALYKAGRPSVFDVSGYDSYNQERLISKFLHSIWLTSTLERLPLVIFLEECHTFIPQGKKTECKPALSDIALRGRKRGLSSLL